MKSQAVQELSYKDLRIGSIVKVLSTGPLSIPRYTLSTDKPLVAATPPSDTQIFNYFGAYPFKKGTVGAVHSVVTPYVYIRPLDPEKALFLGLASKSTFALCTQEEHEVFYRARLESILAGKSYLRKRGSWITGADPEIFAVDGKGAVIPAWEYLPAKPEDGRFDVSFWDGFQAEFTVTPQGCHESLATYMRTSLTSIWEAACKKVKGATLTSMCTLPIPRSMLKAASDEHVALGCAPSTNVYPGVQQLDIPDPRGLGIRSAGCHMHFGAGAVDRMEAESIVRSLDRNYGILSVAILQGIEQQERRMLYGRAGEYRHPKHGIEYRVPSSSVLCHPVSYHLNFDLARLASSIDVGLRDKLIIVPGGDEQVQDIINGLDVNAAQGIIKANSTAVKAMISSIYGGKSEGAYPNKIYDAILNGISGHMNTTDVVGNWGLANPRSILDRVSMHFAH